MPRASSAAGGRRPDDIHHRRVRVGVRVEVVDLAARPLLDHHVPPRPAPRRRGKDPGLQVMAGREIQVVGVVDGHPVVHAVEGQRAAKLPCAVHVAPAMVPVCPVPVDRAAWSRSPR